MTDAALLLAPGAGAGRDHPTLVAIERALVETVAVARMDFPYRLAGRKTPDRPPVLVDAVRTEADALVRRAGVAPSRLILGGRSMGGRMCSLAVADEAAPLPALALVLISYPLHPPGKPDRTRTEHFPRLDVPCLFVSGTSDAFGRPEELDKAAAVISGPVTYVWLAGGDHGLRGRDGEVASAVAGWVAGLVS